MTDTIHSTGAVSEGRALCQSWLVGLSIVLAILAVGLLGAAQLTPWHSDPDAYFAELNTIRSELYGRTDDANADGTATRKRGDFRYASAAFHANQDRYRTKKWLYADLGYSSAAWACLLSLISAFNPGLHATRRLVALVPASLAVVGLTVLGSVASAIQSSGRYQVPEWADSLAIPLFGSIIIGAFLMPIVLAFALAPLLTRRSPTSLLAVRGRGWWTAIPVTTIYAGPVVAGILVQITVVEAGGWAISLAGAILVWLMLNARAIWLGRPT